MRACSAIDSREPTGQSAPAIETISAMLGYSESCVVTRRVTLSRVSEVEVYQVSSQVWRGSRHRQASQVHMPIGSPCDGDVQTCRCACGKLQHTQSLMSSGSQRADYVLLKTRRRLFLERGKEVPYLRTHLVTST